MPSTRRLPPAVRITLIAAALVTCGRDATLHEEATNALVARSMDEVVSLPDEPSAPFGPLRGAFEVTARGAASYRIPLAVPPGRVGLAPDLALEYSSNGAYGLLGMGFQFTGFRSISRYPRSVALDGYAAPIAFDDTDAFCLDGRRLVPVTEADGSVSFRLERDDRSRTVRVTREGLDGFEVWLADGRILEFGLSTASRLTRASGEVLTWALSRMRDRRGNAVEYFYEHRSSPSPGHPEVLETSEFHPAAIRYTANDGSTGAPVLPARREVRFEYGRFADSAQHFGYRAGMRSNIRWGVDRVSMWVEETKVWEYRLHYETSPSTGRARLEFVRRCDAKDVCLPPIHLKWDDGEFGFAASVGTIQSALVLPPEPALLMPMPMDLADLDGDGRSDLVVLRPEGLRWARSIARPGVPEVDPFPTEALAAAGVPARWWSADLNRDGQSELIIETARGLRVAQKSGDGAFAEERFDDLWTEDLDLFEVPLSRGYFFGDLDGDGLQEILGHEESEPETLRFLRWGLPRPTGAFRAPAFARVASTPFDLDGDGASELIGEESPGVARAVDVVRSHLQSAGDVPVATTGSGGTPYRAHLATGTRTRSLPAPVAAAVAEQTLLGDFNGDGLRDYLALDESAPETLTAYFSTGAGFEARTYTSPQDVRWRPANSARNRSSAPPGRGLVGDFNRDGRDDLLVDGVDGKKHVLEFRPEGLQLRTDRTPIPARGDVYALGDINGDGLLDVVAQTVQPHALSIHYQRGRRPDRVVAIREGAAIPAYQISFDTLGSSSVYTRGIDCQSTPPTVCVSGGDAEVVRQVVFDGGTGTLASDVSPAQPVTRTYTYRNARVNQSGRGWLGFEWRVETEAARGRTRTTRYDNFTRPPDYPLLGLVIQDEVITELPATAVAPAQISVVRHATSFAVKETAPGVRVAYPKLEKHDEFFSPSTAAFQHNPPAPTRSLTREVLEVDGWGLPTRMSTELGEGHRYVEQRQYLHDPARWVVARPTAIGVLSVVPLEFGSDQPNQERVFAFEYVPDTGERFAVVSRPQKSPLAPWDVPVEREAEDRSLRVEYRRDAYGNISEVRTSSAGGTPRVETQLFGDAESMFATRQTNALGHATELRYHPAHGVVTDVLDPNNVLRQFAFDGFGRLSRERSPEGADTVIQRAPFAYLGRALDEGYQTEVLRADGSRQVSAVDRLGRELLLGETTFSGEERFVEQEFDGFGRLLRRSVPRFELDRGPRRWEVRAYDNLDRMTSATDADGGQWTYLYRVGPPQRLVQNESRLRLERVVERAYGTELEIRDPEGSVTRIHRNPRGQIQRVLDAAGSETLFSYGAFDGPRVIQDPLGQRTLVHTTAFGERDRMNDPAFGVRAYRLDAYGAILAERDTAGFENRYQYDALGRLVLRYDSAGHVDRWTWDRAAHGLGHLESSSTSEGGLRVWKYDELSRPALLETTVGGARYEKSWKYDALGRIARLEYPIGDPTIEGSNETFAVVPSYSYGRLDALTDGDDASLVYWKRQADDASGRNTLATFGNGVLRSRSFTPGGLLASERDETATGAVLRDLSYRHDPSGRLIERRNHLERTTDGFWYDSLGRLTAARTLPGAITIPTSRVLRGALQDAERFGLEQTRTGDWIPTGDGLGVTYDAAGNIRWKSDVGDYVYEEETTTGIARWMLRSIEARTPAAAGPTLVHYSPRGNVVGRGGVEIAYSGGDKPVRISGPSSVQTFEYDADGEILRHTRPDGYRDRVDEDLRVEVDASGTHHFHVLLHADGEPVAELELTPSSTGASTRKLVYVHADHLGSPAVFTDAHARVVDTRAYDAFGQTRPQASPPPGSAPFATVLGFLGQDDVPGLDVVSMHGRPFDPKLGRFLTPDPLVGGPAVPQSLNRYAYAMNSPLSFRDPSGWAEEFADSGGDDADEYIYVRASRSQPGPSYIDPAPAGFDTPDVATFTPAHHQSPQIVQGPARESALGRGFLGSSSSIHAALNAASFAAVFIPGAGLGISAALSVVDAALYLAEGNTTAAVLAGAGVVLAGATAAFKLVAAARAVGPAATVVVGTTKEAQALVSAAGGRASVALDTNALIAAVERGQSILGGRAPVVPITVVKEFFRGGGSSTALREFLTANGGRVGLAGAEATAASLRQQATGLGRVLHLGDSRVAAGAMREAIPLITNDRKLGNFLRAIGYPVERF